ncbi:MAG: GAF domain-containing protein [Nitrospira sp.]|nr:GAF domain-containing protein [Nitrospira sp.]
MTRHPDPQSDPSQAGTDSLQRLTKFARDMGHPTSLPVIAERILSGLSEASRHSQGLLYLRERERECFRLVSIPTATPSIAAPPVVPLRHPLVQQLADRQDILDSSVLADSLRTTVRDNITDAHFAALPINLAIPLLNRGRLTAFVVLHSQRESSVISSYTLDLLTAMAQSAANALDSFLLYENLRQSQVLMRRTDRLRSLETIAGGFAHEIRNPLTSIKTFIQLAPERKDDSQFIGEFSRIVLDDVNRIERLIQEILDYARYMEPQLTDEDLNEIVSSCLYFIQVKANSRGIKIEKDLAPELPRGMLDRQQIKQVLLNLLLNAMDAIGEKTGTLRVRTSRLQKADGEVWTQIQIEDTGHGISPENLDHIFDPFFTTKHASTVNEGTGLGLTIAHQIVREHRGELHVQSTEGIGTTFLINLPSHQG